MKQLNKMSIVVIIAFFITDFTFAKDVFAPVDIRQVKVGGEIGRRIDVTITNNLQKLNLDGDFLDPFRKKDKGNYIGLGKLIDTVVRMAAYTGEEKVITMKKYLVNETIKTQGPDGYIGNMPESNRMKNLWDIHEMGYIIFGLVSDYRLFGEKSSLEAARKAVDYIIDHWKILPPDWEQKTSVATHVGITGIHRTILALHLATGDKRYLDFCTRELGLPDWNTPIVIGRRKLIEGHAYAFMAACLAQLEMYRLQPKEKLLRQAMMAMNFITAKDGMAITGGIGQCEIWTNDQDGRGDLGESCSSAYQLRVYDSLLRLKGDSRFGDIMERTIYNALFAAQSPDGRQIRYYAPFEGSRIYWHGDTYCCPCNYRRIIAELPSMVYYRLDKGLAVNLYSPSQARIDCDGGLSVTVRQETDYPNSGNVMISIEPSKTATFPVKLRIPGWCKDAKISVNGQPCDRSTSAGTFVTIKREWKTGDKIALDMPMSWRLVQGRQRQAGRAAIMRGPLVFTLNPEQDKNLVKKDGADLVRMIIDLASIEQSPVPSDAVHPGGVACRLKVGSKGFGMDNPGDLTLLLTEFPDPDGKCVYFRVPDLSTAVPDELLGSWK
ncbi:MAG: glycoside hydrolase family 127 protein [Kiritimatiellae bacterium]|nr:glycoside hydrolase family 127 protein [Kiritimatiellia bacterium]MDD5519844.1 glycoside hydrolase family 127 protein [Kiritimatiellia bacterium]